MSRCEDDAKLLTSRGKVPLWLIPREPLELVARAFEFGLRLPGRSAYGWRKSGIKASDYISAANRHEAAWMGREENASDSNVHHLAHEIATKLILLDSILCGRLTDDRPPKVEPNK